MQQLSKMRLWHWLVIFPILAVVGLTGYDYFSRYLSWKNLTKAEIVTSANRYVDERLPVLGSALMRLFVTGAERASP